MPYLGEMLALFGATCFALANVSISLGAVRRKGDNGALLSVIVTAAVSLLIWLVIGAEGALDHAPEVVLFGLAWFVASGLLTTVFGRISLFRSIQELGVVRASALKRLVPFFSAILAWAILGEIITGAMLSGMALIAVGFGLLISRSIAASAASAEGPPPAASFAPGTASALCYAFGYVARKFGLGYLPDAAFGTLASSLGALAYYLLAAPFVADYRRAFREAFTNVNRWQLVSAIVISIGQIALFAALQHSEISRVVMIASLEIFISMFIAVAVLKTEKVPDRPTIAAALLATGGVMLVAVG